MEGTCLRGLKNLISFSNRVLDEYAWQETCYVVGQFLALTLVGSGRIW